MEHNRCSFRACEEFPPTSIHLRIAACEVSAESPHSEQLSHESFPAKASPARYWPVPVRPTRPVWLCAQTSGQSIHPGQAALRPGDKQMSRLVPKARRQVSGEIPGQSLDLLRNLIVRQRLFFQRHMRTGAAKNTFGPGPSLGKHMISNATLIRHNRVNEAPSQGSGELFHLSDCDSTFALFALCLIDCSSRYLRPARKLRRGHAERLAHRCEPSFTRRVQSFNVFTRTIYDPSILPSGSLPNTHRCIHLLSSEDE